MPVDSLAGLRDISALQVLGAHLDSRPAALRRAGAEPLEVGPTVRDWIVEELRIRTKKRGLNRIRLNRAQEEYSQRCSRRNIILKARQLGITTYVAARFFVETITCPGTLTVQVAHSQESAEEIFGIVHRFWENLPLGTREGALVTSHANTRQLRFPRIDSEYRVATAGDVNAGRGMTIHNLHCSEVARWPRGGEEVLASLRAAVTESGQIVLESTPNGATGVFYEEWQRADETGYTKFFFPWWYADEYSLKEEAENVYPLTEEEQLLVAQHGLSDLQIGWRRRKHAELRGMLGQEFAEDPVSCFRASGECVFDLEAVERAFTGSSEPVEMRENRRLMVWLPAQAGKQYIIGVDPAGGGSEGDYACAEVIERQTGMQCAELHGHFPPVDLARKVAKLGNAYNNAMLGVERNNHGYAVLAHLRHANYSNIFQQGNADGWLTNAANRPGMIENLAAVLEVAPRLFHSPRLLNECRTFVRHPDGSSAAACGCHDDCVMAMAIALAVRRAVEGSRPGLEVELACLPGR